MAFVLIETFPAEYEPEPPEPPEALVAEAAEVIRDALVEGRLDEKSQQREVRFHAACTGFPTAAAPKVGVRHYFRWAAKRMFEAGLVDVLRYDPDPPRADPPGKYYPPPSLPDPDLPTEYALRSTPELWRRWTIGVPILDAYGVAASVPMSGAPTNQHQTKPRWNGEERTLYFGDVLVKRYSGHPATEQISILEAFELAGWPTTVRLPEKKRKLQDTVRDLNKSLSEASPIRFHRDGTGEGVAWETTDAHNG